MISNKATIHQIDPTRMNGIRRKVIARLRRSYAKLAQMVRMQLIENLGYPVKARFTHHSMVGNEDWSYETNPNKVKRFRQWLRQRMDSVLSGDAVIQAFIDQAYDKGTTRTFRDIRKDRSKDGTGKDTSRQTDRGLHKTSSLPSPRITSPIKHAPNTRGVGIPPREIQRIEENNFLRMRKNLKPTVEKVKLLASRTFHELEGINQRMASNMSRTLAEGLAHGWTIHKITQQIVKQTGIAFLRANTIVRTELVRAHAEGQLDALEALGEEKVGVAVEWESAQDDRVCPKCSSLQGKVFSIKEARGKIPAHTRCRCAWIPLRVATSKGRRERI